MANKRRECNVEEISMDFTSMIDVVFLLIIFFILMPNKSMEGQLQSYLPNAPSIQAKKDEVPPPIFNIVLTSRMEGNEIKTSIQFNNSPIGEFTTLSVPRLNQIYEMDRAEKNALLGEEYKRDEQQFDPNISPQIRSLISKMNDAALGVTGPNGAKKTDVMISASSNVPFKVVLAILNAGAGAQFENLKFVAPDNSIFKPDP